MCVVASVSVGDAVTGLCGWATFSEFLHSSLLGRLPGCGWPSSSAGQGGGPLVQVAVGTAADHSAVYQEQRNSNPESREIRFEPCKVSHR